MVTINVVRVAGPSQVFGKGRNAFTVPGATHAEELVEVEEGTEAQMINRAMLRTNIRFTGAEARFFRVQNGQGTQIFSH
jgi:hypothetical protein